MANSTFYPTYFLLVGIPGLEHEHIWISFPFCFMYVLALLGNIMVIVVILMSPRLHQPMFIFLSMLAFNDCLLSTSVSPKILSIFWFNDRAISFNGCLLQMFFIHSFTGIESGFLLSMAYDRYIAIYKPLQYNSIITTRLITRLVIVFLVRPVVLVSPALVMIRMFPAFKTNIIAHSYCEHMAVVKLAAADIRGNSILGLVVAFTTLGVDLLFILLSYTMIFNAVFRLPSKDARLKAFNTCTPHMCVFLSFYSMAIFSFLSHRYGKKIPPYVHIIFSDIYLLVPPMLNPLIYGIKTTLIREETWKILKFEKKLRIMNGAEKRTCHKISGIRKLNSTVSY
ncbi:olfactory receptor 52A1-like [Bufo bufo]|uniref:olfactory receptor 52A1-like n=1 Tax=Bufo bufo TaxID=8384 RepID=UPI001ABDEA78|nr:olfactory receptor 52A1-like [Bufo bufo]